MPNQYGMDDSVGPDTYVAPAYYVTASPLSSFGPSGAGNSYAGDPAGTGNQGEETPLSLVDTGEIIPVAVAPNPGLQQIQESDTGLVYLPPLQVVDTPIATPAPVTGGGSTPGDNAGSSDGDGEIVQLPDYTVTATPMTDAQTQDYLNTLEANEAEANRVARLQTLSYVTDLLNSGKQDLLPGAWAYWINEFDEKFYDTIYDAWNEALYAYSHPAQPVTLDPLIVVSTPLGDAGNAGSGSGSTAADPGAPLDNGMGTDEITQGQPLIVTADPITDPTVTAPGTNDPGNSGGDEIVQSEPFIVTADPITDPTVTMPEDTGSGEDDIVQGEPYTVTADPITDPNPGIDLPNINVDLPTPGIEIPNIRIPRFRKIPRPPEIPKPPRKTPKPPTTPDRPGTHTGGNPKPGGGNGGLSSASWLWLILAAAVGVAASERKNKLTRNAPR